MFKVFQDVQSVSDHFMTLQSKGLIKVVMKFEMTLC